MKHLKEDFKEEDYKFLKNTSLWIKAHPERNVKFNKQLKPIRRQIFDNLELNIYEGKWKCINFDVINTLFSAYLKRDKDIPSSDVLKSINVMFDDETRMNLFDCFQILNIIRSQIISTVEDIKWFKKTFFVDDWEPIYSVWQNSLNIDNHMTNYNNFLYNRFFQYDLSFKNGSCELKNIVYCYMLKDKFKNLDFFDFSESKNIIYVDWVAINLNILAKIMEVLNISKNPDIIKKI